MTSFLALRLHPTSVVLPLQTQDQPGKNLEMKREMKL